MKVCRLLGRLSPLNAPRTILALILLLVLSTPPRLKPSRCWSMRWIWMKWHPLSCQD